MNSLRRRCRKEEALRKPPKAVPKKKGRFRSISPEAPWGSCGKGRISFRPLRIKRESDKPLTLGRMIVSFSSLDVLGSDRHCDGVGPTKSIQVEYL